MSQLSSWPALVLTAGLGTRLHPLSSVRAKAALPVAGDVLIARILRRLHDAGIRRAVLNLHHLPETITREVGDGSRFGVQVRYSWEPIVLGSAGGPARVIPLLAADRFLIVNGDTLADVDLEALASAHVASGALVTMAVVDGDPRYGGVLADDGDAVHGFVRGTSTPPNLSEPFRTLQNLSEPFRTLHFIGAQAVNTAAFAGVSPDESLETVRDLYPRLIAARPGSVRTFTTDAEFLDIGTPGDYLHTAARVAAVEGKPQDIGAGTSVEPTALLIRSILWRNVTVEAGASLTECIVADGVTVPAGATFTRCALVNVDGKMSATPF